MESTTIGPDLAKHAFRVHGIAIARGFERASLLVRRIVDGQSPDEPIEAGEIIVGCTNGPNRRLHPTKPPGHRIFLRCGSRPQRTLPPRR